MPIHAGSHNLQYCLVQYQQCEDGPPLVVTHSLVIDQADKTWKIHIHKLEPSLIPSLTGIPSKLTPSSAYLLLHQLSQLKTCIGNPDPDFISLGKEKRSFSSYHQRSRLLPFWIAMLVCMHTINVIQSQSGVQLATCFQKTFAAQFALSIGAICGHNSLVSERQSNHYQQKIVNTSTTGDDNWVLL